jgi:hypothetical protein
MGMTGGGEETASRAIVTLVLLVLLGLVTYAAGVWVMWRMAGRPEGAEVAAVRKALAESERLIPYRRSA